MNDRPDPSAREEALFESVLKLPVEQRAAWLRDQCGADTALRERIESLLKAHEQSGSFLQEPAVATPKQTIVLSLSPEEKTGDKIGRYKLLQKIGEGGCGVVYMAEQEEPVRRRVALKIIKLGMDTKQVIARFEAERQALAMMDHPNIAKVLDAGATETGRPFFVMELVRGIKITDYCDQNKLSTTERLALFVQVCNAIQHAHQKGIIHRDIKPSNILVTLHDGAAVPKVIDFGIAKATQGRLTDQTLFTAFEQFIGTPAYMSPEQAEMSGLDVDTRSDIYALGVLLYELLTGGPPFDPKQLLQSGLDGLRRTIREEEPARPSTRLSTMLDADLTAVAQRRHAEAPKLINALRGDLDWIVMKSLEKDRTRRYETANALAMDIQRSLHNEPVVARPPSTLYRFQKLIRRNRTVFAAAGAGLAVLLIGLIVAVYLYVQERSAVKRATAAEQVEARLRKEAEQSAAWSRDIARAGLLLMRGQHDESEEALRSVPPHATLVPLYNVFGSYHSRRGQWQAALTNWEYVINHAPEDPLGYVYITPLLLQLDDVERYRSCRTKMLRQFGGTSDSQLAGRLVKAGLILPANADETAVIARLADMSLRAETNSDAWSFSLFAKGFSEFRQGHYGRAADWLKQVIALDPGSSCRAETFLVLGMAQFHLNQPTESKASLAKAVDVVEHSLRKPGRLGEDWDDWIIIQVLLREAKALTGDLQTQGTALGQQPAWQAALTKQGLKFKAELQDDGTWDLDLEGQPVADLEILRNVPLSRLSLIRAPISDLRPLTGMPLRKLWLAGTKVTDLSPLEPMQLTFLQISGTRVSDLTPLRHLPLRELKMTDCAAITNIQPLAGISTLTSVILPPNATGLDALRALTNLTHLGFKYDPTTKGPTQTAAEFWAEFDRNKAARE